MDDRSASTDPQAQFDLTAATTAAPAAMEQGSAPASAPSTTIPAEGLAPVAAPAASASVTAVTAAVVAEPSGSSGLAAEIGGSSDAAHLVQKRSGGLFASAKQWFLGQGAYLVLSSVFHAGILLAVLLLMGTAVVPEIHSVAPVFDGQLSTEVPASEFEQFDPGAVRLDPGEEVRTEEMMLANNASDALQASATGAGTGTGGIATGSGTDASAGVGVGSGEVAGGFGSGAGPAGGGGGGFNLQSLKSINPLGRPGGGQRRSSARHGGVGSAEGVGQAVDGVLGGIRGQLEQGDLLVVWLMDASISLLDDRQQIAEHIEPFYQDLETRSKNNYRLMNAVVAFGYKPIEIQKPQKYDSRITNAIRTMPMDPSGLENVMTAIEWCVQQYGKNWKGGMLIIVWTDESGDDILRLEEIIQMCRRRHIVIRVIGPTAVLGSERGTHYWVDKPTGYAFRLPIKRGPDTVLPEKVAVPYWHEAALPPWTNSGATVAAGLPWYGGPHREGLLSGIGPYALTRLALETGGKFTLLDHKEDRGPFKFEKMRPYLPDYESLEGYMKMLEKYPMRKAVSNAVLRTYTKINIQPPIMAYVVSRTDRYPYAIVGGYRSPAQFRYELAQEIPRQAMLASAASQCIEEALAQFPEGGMEYEYAQEPLPRWRAWYDLTRGRLLAMSVRHLEYLWTCKWVMEKESLNPETNFIEFVPSPKYKAAKFIEKRAKEARRLLERASKANADTPWGLLADWELAHELGLEVKQKVIPPPVPGPPGPPSSPPPVVHPPNL